MSKEDIAIMIASLLGGGFGARLLHGYFQRETVNAAADKSRTEVMVTLGEAATELVEALRAEIHTLRTEMAEVRQENAVIRKENLELHSKVQVLTRDIEQLRTQLGRYQVKFGSH